MKFSGTHMGHSTLYTMCKILQDTSCYSDVGLLRGTVFYINMGLWSNKRVVSLRCTLTSVLPSLLQVKKEKKMKIRFSKFICIFFFNSL